MARPGTPKIDFYPDEEAQELLRNLPPNTRSATLNNLVKAHLSDSMDAREDAENRLAEVIRRRNGTSKSKYALSHVDTTNLLHRVFQHLCKKHSISASRDASLYGTLKFSQILRDLNLDPEDQDLTENLLVQSAFFRTIGEMRFWQSELAYDIPEGEVHISSEKWKSGHPPLEGDVLIYELGDKPPQAAISDFVYSLKDEYLDEGQPFICRWMENGEMKKRHLKA